MSGQRKCAGCGEFDVFCTCPEPTELPWENGILEEWDIVGMNHYHQMGERRLFVSMSRDGRCIKAEGFDAGAVWRELEQKAIDETEGLT